MSWPKELICQNCKHSLAAHQGNKCLFDPSSRLLLHAEIHPTYTKSQNNRYSYAWSCRVCHRYDRFKDDRERTVNCKQCGTRHHLTPTFPMTSASGRMSTAP